MRGRWSDAISKAGNENLGLKENGIHGAMAFDGV
jgi:hypothetical protein